MGIINFFKGEPAMGNSFRTADRRSTMRVTGRLIPLALIMIMFPATVNAARLMHNSTDLNSGKWPQGWGIDGGKYGRFTCATCHEPNNGANAKNIARTISSMNEDLLPNGADTVAVVFTNSTAMGDDTAKHNRSNRVCQVCHSKTKYHNYSSGNNYGGLNHPNPKDVCTGCHSHKTGFRASCENCHGNPPTVNILGGPAGFANNPGPTNATDLSTTGSHPAHVIDRKMGCTTCHSGNTMPSVSNTIQMGFNGYGGKVTSGGYTGYSAAGSSRFVSSSPGTVILAASDSYATANRCTNLYCHGGGTSSRAPLGGGTVAAPAWMTVDGSQDACGACHGTTAATVPATGSHSRHAGNVTGSYAMLCSTCHNVTGNTHANGSVEWRLNSSDSRIGTAATYRGYSSGGTNDLGPSNSFGQCANLYCHSNGLAGAENVTTAPTWGTSAGFAGCVGCHGGNADSASPIATRGHRAHINNSSLHFTGFNFRCSECHNSTVDSSDLTITSNTLHVNKVPDVNWGARSTGGLSYTGTCANIYCHSNGAGVYKTPPKSWSSMTEADMGTISCNYCHGGLAGEFAAVSSNRHRNHINAGPLPHRPATCNDCHSMTVAENGVSIYGNGISSMHINRALNVSFLKMANFSGTWTKSTTRCSATWCHATNNPRWTTTTLNSCGSCHYASNAASGLSAAHIKHYNSATAPANTTEAGWGNTNSSTTSANVFMCGVCHPANPASTHLNGPADNSNGRAAELGLRLPFAVRSSARITNSVTPGVTPILQDSRGYQYSSGTTCTTYCHSDGKGGTPILTTFTWNGTLSCGACHNKADDTVFKWSGAHTKHVKTTISSSITCNACHAPSASSNTVVSDRRKHPNGFVNLSGNSVAGAFRWDNATGRCSNIRCHGTGKTPLWTETFTTTCTGCHGGNAASTPPIATKGHSAHINNTSAPYFGFNFRCSECHYKTVAAANDATLKSFSGVRYHIDGTGTVVWGAKATTTGSLAYDPAQKCVTYCHSNGAGLFKNPPKTWNAMSGADEGTIQCDYCHKGIFGNNSTVSSGRHTNHLYGTTYSANIPHKPATCNECHSNTVAGDGHSIYNGADVKHINKQLDVTFLKMGNFSGSWTKSSGTCSMTWCHGERPRTWSTTTLQTCGTCHEASRTASFGLSSSHVKHYNTTTRVTAANGWNSDNASSNSANIFRCGVCHPGKGTETVNHLNGPAATNGSAAELVIKLPFTVPAGATRSETATRGNEGIREDAAGYFFSQGTTCDTYCHSDGRGGPPKAVMYWAKVTSSCGNCHNKSSDNPSQTTWSKPHDIHAISYGNGGTIGSYNTTTNNTLVTCAACHASTATSNTAIKTTGGFSRHPNGFRNISASSTVGSAAFRWDPANNRCKNGYCHSKAFSFTDYSTPWIKWDQAQAQIHCGSCHTSYPTGPDYANGYKSKANSHPKHAVFWGFTCDWCHNQTVVFRNNSTVISTVRNHVNKNYNVAANSSQTFIGKANTFTPVATTSPPATKTTCSNVNCHGGNLSKVFVWGGTNKCGDCHFAASDTVNYTFKNSTMAMISRAEWSYSGHGKQTGTYDVTASPFAGFSTSARVAGATGDPCLYCHEYDAVPHGNTANPMRLRNFNDPVYGKNGVCLACHATGAKGV
ncbi:CxxxxCH/CxxCH domain-containing protein, partial [Geobacter sp. OR-1]|uniref:CxxxxCH/CxxCH domain c-type cytochrome n=1 Tax=Geobacter sp. OR-1 TaxID=1266765 RepID=UPI00069434C7